MPRCPSNGFKAGGLVLGVFTRNRFYSEHQHETRDTARLPYSQQHQESRVVAQHCQHVHTHACMQPQVMPLLPSDAAALSLCGCRCLRFAISW